MNLLWTNLNSISKIVIPYVGRRLKNKDRQFIVQNLFLVFQGFNFLLKENFLFEGWKMYTSGVQIVFSGSQLNLAYSAEAVALVEGVNHAAWIRRNSKNEAPALLQAQHFRPKRSL